METWQRTFITGKLPELVDLTLCNTTLLTLLQAKDILSNEEIHEIEITQNPIKKARKLYEIIVTRKDAYQMLLSACKQTKQTGVVSILEEGKLEQNLLQPDGRNVSSELNLNPPDNEVYTGLLRALAEGGCLNVIKTLIEEGANFLMKDNKEKGALHFAVEIGNKEIISLLLSLHLDVNEVDDLDETPLHKARYTRSRDYLGTTKLLLDNGADLGAKDKNGNNVAHLFACAENMSAEDFQIWVEGMIDDGHGSIFAVLGQHGRTPLQTAMWRLDLDLTTLKLMLESSKLDINHQDDHGSTLLHLALDFGRSLEIIKNLISLGAEIKMKNKSGNGVLHCAVVGGKKEIIKYLISKGIDVNEKNYNGETPLHQVTFTKLKNYVKLTNLLIENGGDLYSKEKNGNTLAHKLTTWKEVSRDDFKTWVTVMIENGHPHLFTIRGFVGRTPLHCAMERLDVDLETIKLIVESAKLDLYQPDDHGDTILHLAIYFGRNLDTIQNLLALGADWKKKGRQDGTILSVAVRGSNKESFLYFKSLGADVNAKDNLGRTVLHAVPWTRSKDYLGMTIFLLDNGANLNTKDNDGEMLAQLMSSCRNVSAEDYNEWKEGMIKLGHESLFHQRSSERSTSESPTSSRSTSSRSLQEKLNRLFRFRKVE